MAFQLTAQEFQLTTGLPESDLVELAVELDIPVEASIQRRDLVAQCVAALAGLCAREGLPFSQWDRQDLEELSPAQRRALARQLGVTDSVKAILRSGKKVYKVYSKQRPRSQVALLLPILLTPLCRYLVERG